MEHSNEDEPVVIQSRYTQGSIVCPACGRPDGVLMWDLLEADCNPERAEQLAKGDLFVHRCAQCGALVPLDYPLLYVDRTHRGAVYYPAGQGSFDAICALFSEATQRFRGIDLNALRRDGIAMRVAPHRYELSEKATVWTAGLDDRIYGVLKLMLLEELNERNPSCGFCDIQLTEVEGEHPDRNLVFRLFVEEVGEDGAVVATPAESSVSIPEAVYARLAASEPLRVLCDSMDAVVVDDAWARRVLETLRSEE